MPDPLEYSLGWHRVHGASHAYLQPNGGWGLNNAGLIIGEGESLLVDTLFDVPHTRRMLSGSQPLLESSPISTVVNTHANGDHWFGNELLGQARIIASQSCAQEMRMVGPQQVGSLQRETSMAGDFARKIFGAFNFDEVTPHYPTETFTGELPLTIGGIAIQVIEVGPAHTHGDVIVLCEQDGVVFTGDIVFAGRTPIVWSGPLSNWIRACERILASDATMLVPGHGPISHVSAARTMADYLQFVLTEATRCYEAGMTSTEAALAIELGAFGQLPESERLPVNVNAVYRELGADVGPAVGPTMFGCMAKWLQDTQKGA